MKDNSVASRTVEKISQNVKDNMNFFKERKVQVQPGSAELRVFRSFMWDAGVAGFGGFAWWLFIVELQNIRKQLLERPQWMRWRIPRVPISRCVLAGLFTGSCYTVLGLDTIFKKMLTEDAGVTAEVYCSAVKEFETCLRDPTCRGQAGLSHDSMARRNTGQSAPKMLPYYAGIYLACAKGAYGARNGWVIPDKADDASTAQQDRRLTMGGYFGAGQDAADEDFQDPWATPPKRGDR